MVVKLLLSFLVTLVAVSFVISENVQAAPNCEEVSIQLNPEILFKDFPPASAYGLTEGYYRKAIHLAIQEFTSEELSQREAYDRFLPETWDDKPFPQITWHHIYYDHSRGYNSYYLVLEFKLAGEWKAAIVLHEINYSQPGFKQTLICAQ